MAGLTPATNTTAPIRHSLSDFFRGRPLLEGGLVKPFIDLTGEPIELQTAAFGHLLLGIEESNPQTRRPYVSNL